MSKRAAFSGCLASIAIVALGLAISMPHAKRHLESVNCGNYMASIGCGAMTWALDNAGRLPSDFRSMSNELSTTLMLVCPGDHGRHPAKDWCSLDHTNCSYVILAPGMSRDDTTNVHFRCQLHGHLGYSDGTVFDGKRRRTKSLW